MNAMHATLRGAAKLIATEANTCCGRSDGYEEDIESMAVNQMVMALAPVYELMELIDRMPTWGVFPLGSPRDVFELIPAVRNVLEMESEASAIGGAAASTQTDHASTGGDR